MLFPKYVFKKTFLSVIPIISLGNQKIGAFYTYVNRGVKFFYYSACLNNEIRYLKYIPSNSEFNLFVINKVFNKFYNFKIFENRGS